MLPDRHDAFEPIRRAGGIEEHRHRGNGLTVLVLPGAAAPVAAFQVTYRVGSRNEGAGLTGATHLLEHLMFKGTERFNRVHGTSVFETLQSVGAQVNATTWYDRTNYYAMLPAEHLSLAVEIEADRMRGALVSDDDLASERVVVLNELDRGENEPIRRLLHAVYAVAFLAHPYGHPVIGWRSDVETVTAGDLRGFYDTYYWPSNATVSIVGRVDPAEALDLVNRHFGAIAGAPEGEGPRDNVTREPEQRGERRVTVRQAGQLGTVLAAYRAPAGLDASADALDVLASILGAGKSSRLHRALTDAGLATGASAYYPRLRDPGLFIAYATLTPEVEPLAVEDVMRKTLRQVAESGITDVELARARRRVVAAEAFGRDGPMAVVSQLNEAIAVGDWTLYPSARERVDAVTPEDIAAAAARVFDDDGLTIGHYVPTSV